MQRERPARQVKKYIVEPRGGGIEEIRREKAHAQRPCSTSRSPATRKRARGHCPRPRALVLPCLIETTAGEMLRRECRRRDPRQVVQSKEVGGIMRALAAQEAVSARRLIVRLRAASRVAEQPERRAEKLVHAPELARAKLRRSCLPQRSERGERRLCLAARELCADVPQRCPFSLRHDAPPITAPTPAAARNTRSPAGSRCGTGTSCRCRCAHSPYAHLCARGRGCT